MKRVWIWAAMTVFISCGISQAAVPRYTITDLGTLGGTTAQPTSINDNGQVIGFSDVSYTLGHPFIWTSRGGMKDLYTLSNGSMYYVYNINNSGKVSGDTIASHAAIWSATEGLVDFEALGDYATVFSTNNYGQCTGQYLNGNYCHAFVIDAGGTMQDLGVLGTGTDTRLDSTGIDINGSGNIVGWSDTEWGLSHHAFLWTPGSAMANLGTLGDAFPYSTATAINDLNQVVGANYGSGPSRAFIWTATEGMRGLNVAQHLDSWAYDINNNGQIVGYIGDHAFVYASGGEAEDLNDLIAPGSGWYCLERATSINNLGQIVGYGTRTRGGTDHAFLLTPTPEPATLGLLAVGWLALLKRRK